MIDVQCMHLTRVYESSRDGLFRKSSAKSLTAVDRLDLEIGQGELFGLLGPNGAGKTTTVKILCTLLSPTSGSATVKGHDVVKEANKVRQVVNMVAGGERSIYQRLTGRENLMYFGALYDVHRRELKSRVEALLELVGLGERADEPVERYSKGMKQRLQIARGLINDPQVIFLDEPTIGLDVDIAKEIRGFIRHKLIGEHGKTVLLTTHYMGEAEEICDRVGFLFKGKLVSIGTPSELSKMFAEYTTLELVIEATTERSMMSLNAVSGIEIISLESVESLGAPAFKLILRIAGDEIVPQAVSYLERLGAKVVSLNVRKPNLEDAYIHLSRRQKG